MSDAELEYLRERVELGDQDAAARLVELAGERADSHELRLLAESGSTAQLSEPVQLAAEQGDLDEVERLASAGDPDGSAVLDALYAEDPADDGT